MRTSDYDFDNSYPETRTKEVFRALEDARKEAQTNGGSDAWYSTLAMIVIRDFVLAQTGKAYPTSNERCLIDEAVRNEWDHYCLTGDPRFLSLASLFRRVYDQGFQDGKAAAQ